MYFVFNTMINKDTEFPYILCVCHLLFVLLFVEQKWHAQWDLILLPSLLRSDRRQNSLEMNQNSLCSCSQVLSAILKVLLWKKKGSERSSWFTYHHDVHSVLRQMHGTSFIFLRRGVYCQKDFVGRKSYSILQNSSLV